MGEGLKPLVIRHSGWRSLPESLGEDGVGGVASHPRQSFGSPFHSVGWVEERNPAQSLWLLGFTAFNPTLYIGRRGRPSQPWSAKTAS
jgi:hypothetical protein